MIAQTPIYRAALWRVRQPGIDLVEATGNHISIARHVKVDVRESLGRARQLLSGTPARRTTPFSTLCCCRVRSCLTGTTTG